MCLGRNIRPNCMAAPGGGVESGHSAEDKPIASAAEIEVIGGYDEPFDSDLPRRPLPDAVERLVRRFTSREQLSTYLGRLPDGCLEVHRHVQWRLGKDGSLGQTSGCAYIYRPAPQWRGLAAADVWPLGPGEQDAEPGGAADGGGTLF